MENIKEEAMEKHDYPICFSNPANSADQGEVSFKWNVVT